MNADQREDVEAALVATAADHPLWWQWWLTGDLSDASMYLMPYMNSDMQEGLRTHGINTPEELFHNFSTRVVDNDLDEYINWLVGVCREGDEQLRIVTAGRVAYALGARAEALREQPAAEP